MTKRTIIYARISTEEGAKGYSFEIQAEACRQWLQAHPGYTEIAAFEETYTGTVFNRPELSKAFQLIEDGKADALIVSRLDRLARKLITQGQIIELLTSNGIEVIAADSGVVGTSRVERFKTQVLGAAAEFDWAGTVEKMQSGRKTKVEKGKWMGSGRRPYGYRKIGERRNAALEIYEPEMQHVRDMFKWYVGEWLSYQTIADRLNDAGVEPPGRGTKWQGKRWYDSTVQRILHNPIYAGWTWYGKRRRVLDKASGKKLWVDNPKEEWGKAELPELAVVSEDTYRTVMKRSEDNMKRSQRSHHAKYLLSGFFRCAKCGFAMVGSLRRGKHWYRCGSAAHSYADCQNKNTYVPADDIEPMVWGWVENTLTNPRLARDVVRRLYEQRQAQVEPKQRELKSVESLLLKREHEINKLVKSIMGETDQTILEYIKPEIARLGREVEELKSERDRLQAEIRDTEFTPDLEREITRIVEARQEWIENLDFETKRRYLQMFKVEVEFRGYDHPVPYHVTASLLPPDERLTLRNTVLHQRSR
jgi:site-specific DNA recombinase